MPQQAAVESKTASKDAPSKKTNDTTNASMKGQQSESGHSSQPDLGGICDQVRSLLNVYSDQATPEDTERVKGILGFLSNLWSSVKSFFSKKPDNPEPAAPTTEAEPEADPQINKSDVLSKLVEIFECPDNKTDIATNSDLMKRIMNELEEADRNSAMDYLYDAVTDPKILMDMIWYRFGVPVVDSSTDGRDRLEEALRTKVANGDYGTPIDWSADGLVVVYRIYLLLPQSDLDLIRCLMHCSDTTYGGAAWGNKYTTCGVYYVDYVPGHADKEEIITGADVAAGKVVGHIDSEDDTRNGVRYMDMTTAHELGHIVDGNSGWTLSGGDMRDVSKWEEFEDNPATVVAQMVISIDGTPYGGTLTDDEVAIAIKVGERYLARKQKNYKNNWAAAAIAIKTDLKNEVKASGAKVDDVDGLAARMTDSSVDSNLLYHLWRGQGVNMSCYNHGDAMRGMARPFHQGYDGQPWFTFDNGRWSDKISCYEFRNPKEEFAETYASYHAAPAFGKKKGEMTPQPLLDWFIKTGLADQEVPEGGSSGQEEAAEYK